MATSKLLGQRFELTGFSVELGGGPLAKNRSMTMDNINASLKNEPFIPSAMFKEEKIRFYSSPGYYFGYFLRFTDGKNKPSQKLWTLGLAFNSIDNNYSHSIYNDLSDTIYSFTIEEDRACINLVIEKLLLTRKLSKRVFFDAGLGGSLGYTYLSTYQFYENTYLRQDFELLLRQYKKAPLHNELLLNEYLLVGIKFRGKQHLEVGGFVKGGLLQSVSIPGASNYGYILFGMLKVSWAFHKAP